MKRLLSILIFAIFGFAATGQTLVLPGDHPDPSVVKIGNTYWASATTSNWMPAFPLLKSKDLKNWKKVGHVFDKLPEWADFYMWAPEITYENGRVYVYYAAHKKDGNLCVGVASADKPEGPYKDHGPLICQKDGSIDAFPMRDENGKLYLIWKEDGNSIKQPTPIWAQEMNEQRTALVGEKKELFRNDLPWEANLVEGVSIIKNNGYFYAFYAAAGCCGPGCTYQTGVARSKTLLGPWEKHEEPILTSNESWKCPGHGTPIEKDGKWYFLYHGYSTKSGVFAGRQGLLNEIKFNSDNWPEFVSPVTPSEYERQISYTEKFKGKTLSEDWYHSIFSPLNYTLKGRNLYLNALNNASGSYIGRTVYNTDYTAEVTVDLGKSTAIAGLGLIGDDNNLLTIRAGGGNIFVSKVKNKKEENSDVRAIPNEGKLYLRMQVINNVGVAFFYSLDGKDYLNLNETPFDAGNLPPWDRALRVGLTSKGSPEKVAVFSKLEVK